MAIALNLSHPFEECIKAGGETFFMTEGSTIQVRHNESGSIVNILNETVPAGVKWEISVNVHIIEEKV